MKNTKKSQYVPLLAGHAGKYMLLMAFVCFAISAGDAYAGANGMSNALCTIPLAVINTSIGRGIATLGIIILGIMATLGRITWTQAVVVGVGISVIFGAASLAGMIAMGAGTAC
jgi:type IV secretory pathway VirB2 component (pilin)